MLQVNGYWTWVAAHGSGAPVKLPYDPWGREKQTGEEARTAVQCFQKGHEMA